MDRTTAPSLRARRAVIAQKGKDVPYANDAVLVKVLWAIVRFRESRKVAAPVVKDG